VAKRSLKALKSLAEKSVEGYETPSSLSGNRQREAPKRVAKSADRSFMKFTTYIRKTTHLGVKTRLVSKEKELSDLVEELLSNWLKENESFEA
jgi:uncharacterized membrane-anchored protein